MREILFRGKRTDNDEWVEGDLVHNAYNGSSRTIPIGIQQELQYPVEVIPETVGQFTELYDNTKWEQLTESEREKWMLSGNMPSEWKGKRVFEGHILHVSEFKNKYVGEVESKIFELKEICTDLVAEYESDIKWEEGEFCVKTEPALDYYDMPISCLFTEDMRKSNPMYIFEVIGNIHDNPEILK